METEMARGTETVLVLGGRGKTGRRVAERLKARGLPVRVGSRSGEPPFDWENPDTWAPALEGVESVYVSYFPDIAIPGAVEAVHTFTKLAVRNGVRRLVLLSGRGEEEAQSAEVAVREVGDEAGLEWTIVRCAWFMQNFDEYFLLEPILAGEVALPSGDVPEPFVDAEDIADVAMAALTEDGHAGEVYELTSPRLLTFEGAVGEIAKATGREIRFVPVSLEEYEAMLAEADVPPEVVSALIHIFGETLDGRNAHLADGVRRALGREPKDFSDYAREVAATGVWDGQPMSGVLYASTLATALGCGLVAGVFFAFSSFVMPALKRLEPGQGIAAMQSINILAITPVFMTALFGTAVACLGVVAWTAISSGGRTTALVLAGGALYIVGTIGVTIARNVPLNDRLATLHPQGANAADRWKEYVATWTAWNHLRSAAALAAAATLTIALYV